MKLSQFELRRLILRKMARHCWWGGKHTAFDNLPKGFPKEQRRTLTMNIAASALGIYVKVLQWKDIKNELKQLIREGIIIPKPTGYGLHVSPNIKFKAEIEKTIF